MGQIDGGDVLEVVVTGGPCAGKTAIIPHLATEAQALGWHPIVVPEASTLLREAGVPGSMTSGGDERSATAYNTAVVDAQLGLGAAARHCAAHLEAPTLILHNRGILDNAAYGGRALLRAILQERGSSLRHELERPAGVIHLTSAACGGDGEHYTRVNNAARIEDAQLARVRDLHTKFAWSGHPQHWVVGYDDDMDVKTQRARSALRHILGHEPEIERKYLLAADPTDWIRVFMDAGMVTVWNIEQRYIWVTDTEEIRIRKIHQPHESPRYVQTTKTGGPGLLRQEREALVTKAHWRESAGAPQVSKTRYVFSWGTHRIEVDKIRLPRTMWVAEVELLSADDVVEMPDFLQIEKETTGQREFSMAALAGERT